jgi:hypothetical protein
LESLIRKLRIQTYKAQVVMCQLTGASLARRSDSEYLSDGQRTEIIRRRDQSLNEGYELQLMVDLLERREREGRENASSAIPKV